MIRPTLTALCLAAASPALALDTCLVGKWALDASALAGAMAGQIGGTVRHVEGGATMTITPDGTLAMRIEDLTIGMTMQGMPEMAVSISGHSNGQIETSGAGDFTAAATDYSLVGTADVMGQRMEVPVSTATGGWGSASGGYTCAGDTLTFTPSAEGSMPPSWQRLN